MSKFRLFFELKTRKNEFYHRFADFKTSCFRICAFSQLLFLQLRHSDLQNYQFALNALFFSIVIFCKGKSSNE